MMKALLLLQAVLLAGAGPLPPGVIVGTGHSVGFGELEASNYTPWGTAALKDIHACTLRRCLCDLFEAALPA